jgi:hypothetical protein
MNIPAEYNALKVYKRTDWSQTFALKASDGVTTVNLTGYSAAFNIRDQQTDALVVAATCAISVPTSGQIVASLTDTETAALEIDRYKCELLLTMGTTTDPYLIGALAVL